MSGGTGDVKHGLSKLEKVAIAGLCTMGSGLSFAPIGQGTHNKYITGTSYLLTAVGALMLLTAAGITVYEERKERKYQSGN